jgi:chromosome segregation ATPase
MVTTVGQLLSGQVRDALIKLEESDRKLTEAASSLQQRVAALEAVNAVHSRIDALVQQVSSQEERLQAHHPSRDQLVQQVSSQEEGLQARHLSRDQLCASLAMLQGRIEYMERLAGLTDGVPGENATADLFDQRLRWLEMRIMSYLEGPYLARLSGAAATGNEPDGK